MSDVVFSYEGGWACSRDANRTTEVDLETGPDGKTYSKHKPIIQVMDYFTQGRAFQHGSEVLVALKDDDGNKLGFKAVVSGMTDEYAVLNITGDIDFKKVVSTIKTYQNGK